MLHDPPSKPERSFEIVARRIAAMIQASYRIGQRLPAERDLAKTFGVSRPTVREAILSLAMAGMLKVRSNSGVYVISRQEAPDVHVLEGFGPFENLEARQLIEPQIAAIAAQRGSEAAFAQLAEALAVMRWEHAKDARPTRRTTASTWCWPRRPGTARWCRSATRCGAHRPGVRHLAGNSQPHADGGLPAHWRRDHEAIFEAVQARNPRKASHAMTRHLTNIRDALMEASKAKSMATKKPANSRGKIR